MSTTSAQGTPGWGDRGALARAGAQGREEAQERRDDEVVAVGRAAGGQSGARRQRQASKQLLEVGSERLSTVTGIRTREGFSQQGLLPQESVRKIVPVAEPKIKKKFKSTTTLGSPGENNPRSFGKFHFSKDGKVRKRAFFGSLKRTLKSRGCSL